MEQEIWKPIIGYESLYEVSSFGRVKSLSKKIIDSKGRERFYEEKILSSVKNMYGYTLVTIYKDTKAKTFRVHRLVAFCFNNILFDDNVQVNHLDFDRSNNKLSNLEFVNNRENSTHSKKSKLTGASFCNTHKKYYSCIKINKKSINLGYFNTEKEAHERYLEALKEYGLENKYATKSQDNS